FAAAGAGFAAGAAFCAAGAGFAGAFAADASAAGFAGALPAALACAAPASPGSSTASTCPLAADGDDLLQHAVGRCRHLEHDLVGLEVHEVLVATHGVSGLLVPGDERGVRHGLGQLRNLDLNAHGTTYLVMQPVMEEKRASRSGALAFASRRCERRGDERLLLPHVQGVDARRGCGSARATGIEQLVLAAQRLLQAVPNLVPRALILGLFLTPDDFLGVLEALDDASILVDRERIQLLDPNQSDTFDAFVAPVLGEVVVDLAAAEDDAANVVGVGFR